MKVTETGNQLIVQSRFRSVASMLIFGLMFALSGLATFWFFGRHATLECTRLEVREVRCEIKQTLLGMMMRRVEVLNPREAITEVNEDSDGDTYRVSLVTARGTVPLTEHYSSDTLSAEQLQQINHFLSDTTARALSITQPPSPWIYLFPFCFTGAGIMMILAIRFESYTFDRDHDVLIVKRESLRGTQKREEPLHGLHAVVRESKDSDGDPVYGVHVVLASGTDIALGPGSSRAVAQQQLADRIQNFIKSGVRITYVDVKD
jgi:hypothetical protein